MLVASKPANAEYPSSLPPSLWWTPAKVAIHNGRSWKTFYTDYITIAKLNASATIAVSPLDANGQCWYLAFDVDSGGLDAVRRIIGVLPKGCRVLISRSGGRNGAGYHIWLFVDRPLELETAVSFLRLVLAKAGITKGVEVFPESKNSRALKLPGSLHPQTLVCEEFINLDNGESYDTAMVWQTLHDELYRTPAQVVEEYVKANAPVKAPKQQRKAKARTPREATRKLASDERLVDYLMRLAGRQPVRVGVSFRCILPGHQERHPSANFVRGEGGLIFYHDWHMRSGFEWLTLGEVYHALVSGQVRKLKPVENARWLALLGLQAGVLCSQAASCRKQLEELTFTFFKFLKEAFKEDLLPLEVDPSTVGCGSFILQVVCKKLSTTDQSKGRRKQVSTSEALLKVWEVFTREALITAQVGFSEVNLSSRFLAKEAGLPLDVANRGLNLLAALGFVVKTPRSGGKKGDRYVLGEATLEEALQKWEALGRPTLRQFKASLVVAKLGEETAKAIFRRAAGQEKALVAKRNQSGNQTEVWCKKETNPATNAVALAKRYSNTIPKVFEYHSKGIQIPSEDFGMSSEDILTSLEDIPAKELFCEVNSNACTWSLGLYYH